MRSVLVQTAPATLGDQNTAPRRPLNQEDLLSTELTFVLTVFEVLEKFGLLWSEEQQLAYLHTWQLIGRCLGICDDKAIAVSKAP